MPKPLSALFIRKATAYHRERALEEAGGDPKAAVRLLRREIRHYSKEDPERRGDLLMLLQGAVEQLQAGETAPKKPARARKKPV